VATTTTTTNQPYLTFPRSRRPGLLLLIIVLLLHLLLHHHHHLLLIFHPSRGRAVLVFFTTNTTQYFLPPLPLAFEPLPPLGNRPVKVFFCLPRQYQQRQYSNVAKIEKFFFFFFAVVSFGVISWTSMISTSKTSPGSALVTAKGPERIFRPFFFFFFFCWVVRVLTYSPNNCGGWCCYASSGYC
ncbi:hypothetical protein B0T21DRAFT_354563, partial [Apiosordaria backusii]